MSEWVVSILDENVEAEIASWSLELRAALKRIVERIECVGLQNVGEPFVKHIEGKIWEMRASARQNQGRALYVAMSGKRVVIVVAFEKKTQKTPRRFIELALDRLKRISP